MNVLRYFSLYSEMSNPVYKSPPPSVSDFGQFVLSVCHLQVNKFLD